MWMRSVSWANYFYQLHKSKLVSGRFIHTEIIAEGSGALSRMFIWEVGSHVPWHSCGVQGATFRQSLFLSTEWVLGIKLKLEGLAASSFTCCAVSPDSHLSFKDALVSMD